MILGVMLLGYSSCQRDFDKISTSHWNPDLASPFIKTKMTLHDLIGTDSTFDYTDDSLLIYYYVTDSIIYFTADTLVHFNDTSTVSDVSMSAVAIEDFSMDANIAFMDILPNIDPEVADTLLAHDGEDVIIPPFSLLTPYEASVPPIDVYESVTFSEGYIDISVTNSLNFSLKDIDYEILDAQNNTVVQHFNVALVPPGNTAHDTIWLNGRTLSNTFVIKANTFGTDGTAPNFVHLDLSQGLEFNLSSHNIKVVGGSAIINEQVNYEDETYVDMSFDEAKINKVIFDQGVLHFGFQNEFGLGVKVKLQLSSANVNGEIPTQEFELPANGSYDGSWDLSNMEIDLTTDTAQPYNRFPVYLKVDLLSSTDPVYFDTTQKVHVDFSTNNVTIGYVEGNVGRQVTTIDPDTTEIDVSMFDVVAGDIYFDQAQLSLSYTNGFGVPLLIHTSFTGVKESTGEELNLGIDSIIIQYPESPGEIVDDQLVFNKENSNIVEFLNFRPNKIIYYGDAVTNWNNDTINFISIDSKMLASSELKIPMVFRTPGLIFKDTTDFELGDVGMEIGKGRLYLDVTNGFPFDLQFSFQVPDSISGEILDSLVFGTIPSAEVNEEGKVVQTVEKLVTADINEDFIDHLQQANQLFIWAKTVTAQSGSIPVGLYADYEMSISVSIQMQIAP